jgi:formate hydrogenlyase subunit 3/multisubunit Na+/H+ antiporter MnhD subunit
VRFTLFLTIGAVLVVAGATLSGFALWWLSGSPIDDPMGPIGKQMAAARLGAMIGVLSMLLGLVATGYGAVLWRHQRSARADR